MKNHGSCRARKGQGYNAQAVVEQDSHIVVATHVSQAANDKPAGLNELKKVEEDGQAGSAGWYHSKETRWWNHRAVYRGQPGTNRRWKIVSMPSQSVLLMRMR